MSGGMLDGALSVAQPQGEPTPDETADESAPTPTPETEKESEHEEETELEEETEHEEDNSEESSEEDTVDTDADDEAEHYTPPAQNGQEAPPVATDKPVDYGDYDNLESIMIQNAELTAQLLDTERTNGVLLAILLAAVLADIFWKRILR